MRNQINSWAKWKRFFASRSDRQLPSLEDDRLYPEVPPTVAKSLAIFQLGESGGGSIIRQARESKIAEVDENYAKAMALFVSEEHRHAEILAICVRNLGGTLIRTNWTARIFVFARRLIGLRLKVVVLLAAEVVGLCYYHLLATRLPPSRLTSLLAQIVNDERAHLHFHCEFLRSQTTNLWRRAVFRFTWRSIMLAASIVVLIDHRATLRDLELPIASVWRRWMSYSNLAERLVTNDPVDVNDNAQIPARFSQPLQPLRGGVMTHTNRQAVPEFAMIDVKTATSR
jgi:hypothetical protein